MSVALRQQMLELHYGLLPETEAAELRRRIAAEPELAKIYSEVQQTAALLAQATKFTQPRIPLPKKEIIAMSTSSTSNGSTPLSKSPNSRQRRSSRGTNWLLGAAAGLLIAVSIGGYIYHRIQVAAIAAEHLRLVVTGPATIQTGAPSVYDIQTSGVTGDPLSAQIEFDLDSPEGKIHRRESTDQQGRLQVVVPADMRLRDRATIKVVAFHHKNTEKFSAPLAVAPIRFATRLSLDRPLYQPGETVFYRSLTLSRSGLAAEREFPVEFKILDPSGAVVPGSIFQGRTDRGAGNGAFALPAELPGGQYTLVVRSGDGSFTEEKQEFFLRAYRLPRLKKELEFARDSYAPGETVKADFSAKRAEGGPAAGAKLKISATVDGKTVFEKSAVADANGGLAVEFKLPEKIDRGDGQLAVIADDGGTQKTLAKTIPINLGKVLVQFYPEGGDLAAGLKNRVYFTSRDPLGKPVHVEGLVVDDQGKAVAKAETLYEGRGSFEFTPMPNRTYHLKITKPAGVAEQPALPATSVTLPISLDTGTGVYAPDAPLEFTIRSREADLPLVVTATCRGALVGQQTVVTQGAENGINPVVLPLPEGVGGVIRLTVYDYGDPGKNASAEGSPHPNPLPKGEGTKLGQSPKPLAERLVYRRMDRKLTVRTNDRRESYSPGDKVVLSLNVTDEKGKPVPAALGVSVVDDALLSLADDHTPNLTTHFLLTTEIEKPEDLEDADFYLSNEKKNGVGAETALDLLLGTQGWRRFAEKTLREWKKDGPDRDRLVRLAAVSGPGGPPLLYDNLGKIQKKYEKGLDNYRAQRTQWISTLMTVCFLSGLGLLLLMLMLGILRAVSGAGFWLPALGATTCCMILGLILVAPQQMAFENLHTVAFRPYQPPTRVERQKEIAQQLSQWDEYHGLVYERLFEEKPPIVYPDKEVWERLEERRMQRHDWKFGFGEDAKKEKAFKPLMMMATPRIVIQEEDEKKLGVMQLLDGIDRRYIVRQYAHEHQPSKDGVRSDFAETLYWNPLLVADAEGNAEIKFDLSDAVTAFRLRADAHGAGRIGSGQAEIVSRLPFNLEPKLPLEVTAGDFIDLPLAVVNDGPDELDVALKLDHDALLRLDGTAKRELKLPAGSRQRVFFGLDVTGEKGASALAFHGTAGALSDAVSRKLKIVPPGFPKTKSYSGQIDGPQEVTIHLPDQWVPGSLEVSVNAFPSMLANLQRGLDGILREPNGCFEQASTSNYPNVMTMQYLEENDLAEPEVTRKARGLLKSGYVKLTGYESKDHGYEWFGGNPGHEALTAYGLMQFRDMKHVYDVDGDMLRRTTVWLMTRRDGKGGFQRNPRALDSFGQAPPEVTDAYITWALSESGQQGIDAEVTHSLALAEKTDDPYVIALSAAAALNTGKQDAGRKLLEKLATKQADDGHLDGKLGSITRSGGQSLQMEATALAALAWLKLPAFTAQANKAVQWIVGNRQGGGGFGSTQATILALKALTEHAKANKRSVTAGKLIVQSEGKTLGERSFQTGQQETIAIDDLEAQLKPGDNLVTLSLTSKNEMPYTVDVSYRTLKPDSDEKCPVRLKTFLAKDEVKSGETVALTAELTNATDQGQPMTVAILGLPAGLEPRPDQLEELKKSDVVDFYETRPREVICYWRSLAPKRNVQVKLDLLAAVPGRYTAPASRAYLYYTPEQKQWCEPLKVMIGKE
ncbi:MAG: hypothetical protein JXB10_09550 [Pirellulales bacterium]|nr:hypothetical protein [Pirellulales bacterium]